MSLVTLGRAYLDFLALVVSQGFLDSLAYRVILVLAFLAIQVLAESLVFQAEAVIQVLTELMAHLAFQVLAESLATQEVMAQLAQAGFLALAESLALAGFLVSLVKVDILVLMEQTEQVGFLALAG